MSANAVYEVVIAPDGIEKEHVDLIRGKLLDEGYSRDAVTVRDHEQDRVSVRKADLVELVDTAYGELVRLVHVDSYDPDADVVHELPSIIERVEAAVDGDINA